MMVGPLLSSLLNGDLGFSRTIDCLWILFALYYIFFAVSTFGDLRGKSRTPKAAKRKQEDEEHLVNDTLVS